VRVTMEMPEMVKLQAHSLYAKGIVTQCQSVANAEVGRTKRPSMFGVAQTLRTPVLSCLGKCISTRYGNLPRRFTQ
jgi:hypothetical protein